MGIGRNNEFEFNQSLCTWTGESGYGLSGLSDGDLPNECFDFILDQARRFKLPEMNTDFVNLVAFRTFMYFDFYDVYYQFTDGVSDVEIDTSWHDNAYDIIGPSGVITEANPEEIETFKHFPRRDQFIFDQLINNPGLHNLPDNIGEELMLFMGPDFFCGDDVLSDLDKDGSDWLKMVSSGNHDKALNYVKFVTWAMYVWYFGPLARSFRTANPIYESCQEHGECILHEGFVVEPTHYRKIARPPKSCFVCGLDSWCVELVHIQGVTRNICEYHLNGDQPSFGMANCGQKICRYVECCHHPDHGKHNALLGVMRKTGQLSKSNDSNFQIASEQKMAIGFN